MKEELLHFLWKYLLFPKSNLRSTQSQNLQIFSNGTHNHLGGPDFLNAKIEIANQLWFGNIEIHVKSSDWYHHQHEKDKNYDAVILHVVWEHDTDVFVKNNESLPTLELRSIVSDSIIQKYQDLILNDNRWIPCERDISKMDRFSLLQWHERLYVERLEQKAIKIVQLLKACQNDWETVLFQLLAKNFGLKVNGDAFLSWSQKIPIHILRKERVSRKSLSALFFGQAGFLVLDIEDPFYLGLQKEYSYIQHKYKLQAELNNSFQFFGIRPNSFPTIRIAQLVSLYHQHSDWFSKIIGTKKKSEAYDLFQCQLDDYWLTHYTFQKESPIKRKGMSRNFIDLIIMNTIVPIQFAFSQLQGKETDLTVELLREVSPENNSIIAKFKSIGIGAKNALETQALLELKNNYCAKKRCLQCAIGLKLLKS